MQIIHDPCTQVDFTRKGWAGLGNFDGIHLGHQLVIDLARQNNPKGPVGVVTFFPHPLAVVDARRMPVQILSLQQRIEILEAMGLDFTVVYTFNSEFAMQTPAQFLQHRLRRDLGLNGVAVGRDFLFGRDRAGDVDLLVDLGRQAGIEVAVANDFVLEGGKVSSSRIRHVLQEGMVDLAKLFLGRPFFVDGKVVHGDGRGRSLGFPTVNMHVQPDLCLRDGVYAGAIRIGRGERIYPAACHIGPIPTFNKEERTLEVHIIGLDEDLYDHDVRVWFVNRLRGIERFADADSLVKAIRQDVVSTTKIIKKQNPGTFRP